MTKAQRRAHKLGNAIRALRGTKLVIELPEEKIEKWKSPVDYAASKRVTRWAFRCHKAGQMQDSTLDNIKEQVEKKISNQPHVS